MAGVEAICAANQVAQKTIRVRLLHGYMHARRSGLRAQGSYRIVVGAQRVSDPALLPPDVVQDMVGVPASSMPPSDGSR